MGKFATLNESLKQIQNTEVVAEGNREVVNVILKAFNEKTEEFKPHTSHFTGHVYHLNKEHSHAVHNLEHGKSANVEAVHHDGQKLHVKPYTAHKVGNAIHLHDSDDVHVDSFKA